MGDDALLLDRAPAIIPQNVRAGSFATDPAPSRLPAHVGFASEADLRLDPPEFQQADATERRVSKVGVQCETPRPANGGRTQRNMLLSS